MRYTPEMVDRLLEQSDRDLTLDEALALRGVGGTSKHPWTATVKPKAPRFPCINNKASFGTMKGAALKGPQHVSIVRNPGPLFTTWTLMDLSQPKVVVTQDQVDTASDRDISSCMRELASRMVQDANKALMKYKREVAIFKIQARLYYIQAPDEILRFINGLNMVTSDSECLPSAVAKIEEMKKCLSQHFTKDLEDKKNLVESYGLKCGDIGYNGDAIDESKKTDTVANPKDNQHSRKDSGVLIQEDEDSGSVNEHQDACKSSEQDLSIRVDTPESRKRRITTVEDGPIAKKPCVNSFPYPFTDIDLEIQEFSHNIAVQAMDLLAPRFKQIEELISQNMAQDNQIAEMDEGLNRIQLELDEREEELKGKHELEEKFFQLSAALKQTNDKGEAAAKMKSLQCRLRAYECSLSHMAAILTQTNRELQSPKFADTLEYLKSCFKAEGLEEETGNLFQLGESLVKKREAEKAQNTGK